jgi:hypothetical protein
MYSAPGFFSGTDSSLYQSKAVLEFYNNLWGLETE